MHSWLFRNRARLATLYGVAGTSLAPAPARPPSLRESAAGPVLVPHSRRFGPDDPRVR